MLITLLFVIVYLIVKKINENSRNKLDDLFHTNHSINELLTEDVMNQMNKEYSDMEICLAFPTRQVLELFIHKIFILINTLNKIIGNDNENDYYLKYLLDTMTYTLKMLMLKMLPIVNKTDNLGLFDIYDNLKKFLDSIVNYDKEIKNIFRGDISYNLALIEKTKLAANEVQFWGPQHWEYLQGIQNIE